MKFCTSQRVECRFSIRKSFSKNTTLSLSPPSPDPSSSQANLKDAWSTILEEHLLKKKPTKQVFVGAGLPILPKCITDKMLNWEYLINSSPTATQGAKRIRARPKHQNSSCSSLDWTSYNTTTGWNTPFYNGRAGLLHTWLSWHHSIVHMCADFSIIIKEFSGNVGNLRCKLS